MIDNFVSVVMPAYNAEKTIGLSIESVLSQTYSNWELLVVDDNSGDKTSDIVRSFRDKRIRYIRQKKQGVSAARNRAISEGRGRYLAFLDSDDLWLPHKLDHQLKFMKDNEVGFCYTQYRHFSDDPECFGKLVQAKECVDYEELLKGNDIGCLTVMIDRTVYPIIEMPSAYHEDYIAWLRLLKDGGKAYSLAEDLARYRKSDASISGNKWKSMKWTWQVYRKSEGIGIAKSLYYMLHYTMHGINRHIR